MSILNKYNKGRTFVFETPETFEYVSVEDLYNNTKDTPVKLNALFINPKSRFGDSAVAVTDKELVNLPMHMVDTVKEMISDDDVVELVNNGKVAIQPYEYTSVKWGTNYSVNFIEL